MAKTKSLGMVTRPFGVSSKTASGVISWTLVSKNALTSPSLMRFSMSGLIQYFTFGVTPGPR